MDSILGTVKGVLEIPNDDSSYDIELINDINFALTSLYQLGIGPVGGLVITGLNETWTDLLGPDSPNLEAVKANVIVKVRSLFYSIIRQSNPNSILDTIKKMLGLQLDDNAFDTDIIVDINSTFMSLSQLGIVPIDDFCITGASETWSQLFGEVTNLEAVKSYMYLKVRLLFDPPITSVLVDAINRQITEFEFRLNIQADPAPALIPVEGDDDDYE